MTTSDVAAAPLAWFSGDDDQALDDAVAAFAQRVEASAGGPLERWRVRGDELDAGRLYERVATPSLFGGGTAVVVVGPGPLIRSAVGREATIRVLEAVAAGNALAFVEPLATGGRPTAASSALRDAIAERGGETREFRAPNEARLASWIRERAAARGLPVAPGAAEELAARVGASVREADVDRRQMSARAAAELEKLALYRPGGPITRDDVRAVVVEEVPASAWAFLDAVGSRKAPQAAAMLEAILASTPEPVLLAQLHRRIRELIAVADLLASGAAEAALVRTLKLNPYRAKVLAGQARAWSPDELDAALDGLLDLDAAVKGADPATPRQIALRFQLWVGDRVATPAAGRKPSRGPAG